MLYFVIQLRANTVLETYYLDTNQHYLIIKRHSCTWRCNWSIRDQFKGGVRDSNPIHFSSCSTSCTFCVRFKKNILYSYTALALYMRNKQSGSYWATQRYYSQSATWAFMLVHRTGKGHACLPSDAVGAKGTIKLAHANVLNSTAN